VKIIKILLAALLLTTYASAADAGIKLTVDGETINISPKIISENGAVYIPLSAVTEFLYGSFAEYSPAGKKIVAVNRTGEIMEFTGGWFRKSGDYYVAPEFLNKAFGVGCVFDETTGTVIVSQAGKKDISKLPEEIRELGEVMLMRHYQPGYFARYIKYKKANPAVGYFDAVTYVNIGLDYPFYSDDIKKQIKNPGSYYVLCNKYNYLPEDYVPDGYKKTDGRVLSLRGDAQLNFGKMRAEAAKSGINLYILSGYRSYAVQNQVYNNYKRSDPAGADIYSARPGHSEHQTGLAADINAGSASARFENTKEYAWLTENAHKHGFVLRYPKGKEWITGYMFEPWHWRYAGEKAAAVIKESDITYDEYCAIYRVPQNYRAMY